MARTFKRPNRLNALSAIDITPLIDLAFSLLIIFMISAPLLEQTIQVDLPVETTKPQTPREDQVVRAIAIDENGSYFWGERQVSPEQLVDLLNSAAREETTPVISLRADRSLPYQQVITVIDLIKQAGLDKLDLDTQAE